MYSQSCATITQSILEHFHHGNGKFIRSHSPFPSSSKPQATSRDGIFCLYGFAYFGLYIQMKSCSNWVFVGSSMLDQSFTSYCQIIVHRVILHFIHAFISSWTIKLQRKSISPNRWSYWTTYYEILPFLK